MKKMISRRDFLKVALLQLPPVLPLPLPARLSP